MSLKNSNYCVIMAGGIGSRFWPMSRQQKPKQFLDVLGTGKSLLQETFDRFIKIIPKENIFIVTNRSYEQLVLSQIPEIESNQILLEPSRRNTAPCIAYAINKIALLDEVANVIVAPSDHLILHSDAFLQKVNKGFEFVSSSDSLLTLGIKPSRPDTGYGYIQMASQIEDPNGNDIRKVKTFTEKPNIELAKSFVSSGEFLWNSGIFIASVKSLIASFEVFLPDIQVIFNEGRLHYFKASENEFVEQAYAQCTNISIDYGIMEKAPNVFVLPSEFGWSDLGTWGSLYENSIVDKKQNAVLGKNVVLHDVEGCVINMPKDKLVVIQGLKDYIVVESDGILLICKRDDEQEIKQMVTTVRVEKGEEFA